MPKLDYRAWLNLLGLVIFATLFFITLRRGVRDPVCGMRVDKTKAISFSSEGQTHYFCSEHCRHRFEAQAQTTAGNEVSSASEPPHQH